MLIVHKDWCGINRYGGGGCNCLAVLDYVITTGTTAQPTELELCDTSYATNADSVSHKVPTEPSADDVEAVARAMWGAHHPGLPWNPDDEPYLIAALAAIAALVKRGWRGA